MAEFQPILISTEGTSIPYKEGQFIFAEKSFNDGEGTTYAAGVYVDAENVRKWVTRQGAPGKDGTDGTDGTNGIGISSVDSINHSIVGDETVTACRVEYDGDKQPTDFYVYAENGKNGAINMILGAYTGQYEYIWCMDTPVRTGVIYIALVSGTNGPNKVGDIVECQFMGGENKHVAIKSTLGNIRGASGLPGTNGRSITSVNSVSHEIVGDETITHCDVMYDEGNSTRFDVHAKNGQNGGGSRYLHSIELQLRNQYIRYRVRLDFENDDPTVFNEASILTVITAMWGDNNDDWYYYDGSVTSEDTGNPCLFAYVYYSTLNGNYNVKCYDIIDGKDYSIQSVGVYSVTDKVTLV